MTTRAGARRRCDDLLVAGFSGVRIRLKPAEMGVVQNQPIWGYRDVQKLPACKSWILVGRWSLQEACSSLRGSEALRLKRSQAQQRQPMRMALAGHQLLRAFAGALGTATAHEAPMVQEEL